MPDQDKLGRIVFWFLPSMIWIVFMLFILKLFVILLPIVILGALIYCILQVIIHRRIKRTLDELKTSSFEKEKHQDGNEKIIDVEVIKD